jgi:hypothetical protein
VGIRFAISDACIKWRSSCESDRGENLCALLDAEPSVTHSGVIHERWTFSDSSSIVLRHVFWEVQRQ